MSRDQRALLAKQTVSICDAGFYVEPSGRRVEISEALLKAKSGTVIYSADKPPARRPVEPKRQTRLEVRNETTFEALQRMAAAGSGHMACLNFASAKNPGGGFLNGSLAQEEALACASGLYPCLLKAPQYYELNRSNKSALYLDLIIFSPLVPFIRNDRGTLLKAPIMASVITAPAPNRGAIAQNEPTNLRQVESTLQRRAWLVMETARAHEVERLVLGAWGCGVFRNDPRIVARVFGELLRSPGEFTGTFADVIFAVLDRSDDQQTFRAFASEFKGAAALGTGQR